MNKVKYIAISEEIAESIRNGAFRLGDKLYSRNDLMSRYHIGEGTANRIQNVLSEQKYVRKVKGGGIYVSYNPQKSYAARLKEHQLHSIDSVEIFRVKLGDSQPKVDFNSSFYDEIDRCMKQTTLSCKYHEYTPTQVSETQIPSLPIRENTGYLGVSIGSVTMFYTAGIFLNPMLHNVMLDTYVPGSNAVLTDSVAGMENLVDYALERGFRRFIVVRNLLSCLGEFYERERFDAACKYIRAKRMFLQTLESGSFQDLIAGASGMKQPFCIMFAQDEEALRFCHLTASVKLPKHLVTGFNNFPGVEKPDYPVATIAVNHKAMVEAAFRLLQAPMALRKEIVRVPGTLLTEINYKI